MEFDFIPINLLQKVIKEIDLSTANAKEKLETVEITEEEYKRFILAKIDLKNQLEQILVKRIG